MNIINVKDCIDSSYAMAKEDGVAVLKQITEEIDKNGFAELDFEGIERATSLFFNESVCKIAGKHNIEEYQNMIKVRGMSDTLKVIYLRALNLTFKKIESPETYNEALREGIKANAAN